MHPERVGVYMDVQRGGGAARRSRGKICRRERSHRWAVRRARAQLDSVGHDGLIRSRASNPILTATPQSNERGRLFVTGRCSGKVPVTGVIVSPSEGTRHSLKGGGGLV